LKLTMISPPLVTPGHRGRSYLNELANKNLRQIHLQQPSVRRVTS
jgi:hypothetical protein